MRALPRTDRLRAWTWGLVAVLFVGCADPGAPETLSLRLREGASDDEAFTAALGQVELVVAVLGGNDGRGGRCIVGQRCADFVDVLDEGATPSSVEDLQAALEGEAPPLFDFATDDATSLTVVGRRYAEGCFCPRGSDADESFCGAADRVCGVADLADAGADGRLRVTLTEGPCPERSAELCPP